MKIPLPPLRIVFALLGGFMALLAIVVARILEVRGIIQARDVNILLVSLVVLFLILPYIVIPIYFHRVYRLSANHDYEVFHPGRQVVPEEAWSQIREAVASLNPCGFKLVGHFRKSGVSMAFVMLMQSTDQLTIATVITVLTTTKNGIGERLLGFFTELGDGTEIVTGNNRKPSLRPHPKRRFALWLPDVRNPHELYDFHRRLMERFGSTPKCFNLNGNAAEYLNQHGQAEVAHWIEKRYYKLDPAAQVYRLTWKGAALIGWSYLWPVKPIWRAWRRYQTKKLLWKLEE